MSLINSAPHIILILPASIFCNSLPTCSVPFSFPKFNISAFLVNNACFRFAKKISTGANSCEYWGGNRYLTSSESMKSTTACPWWIWALSSITIMSLEQILSFNFISLNSFVRKFKNEYLLLVLLLMIEYEEPVVVIAVIRFIDPLNIMFFVKPHACKVHWI